MKLDKSYYNTIVSQSFSPCGKYYVAGNVYGDIAVFRLGSHIIDTEAVNLPKYLHLGQSVNSMVSTPNFLVCGTASGQVMGFDWDELISAMGMHDMEMPQSKFCIRVNASQGNMFDYAEVNCLKIRSNSKTENTLMVGCGDDHVYAYDLENGKRIGSYAGSGKSYVHTIDISENMLVSGEEDGHVRMWDIREPVYKSEELVKATNVIVPAQHTQLERPQLGNWIAGLAFDQNWLVCGGGCATSVWNMRHLDKPMNVLNAQEDDGAVHSLQFHTDGELLIAGELSYAYFMTIDNQLRSKVQTTSSVVFSTEIRQRPNDVEGTDLIAIVGNSNQIDLACNRNYRQMQVSFY